MQPVVDEIPKVCVPLRHSQSQNQSLIDGILDIYYRSVTMSFVNVVSIGNEGSNPLLFSELVNRGHRNGAFRVQVI